MARQWKSYFFMFSVNYGDKQMVPIQKLFSKIMQGSGRYNNVSAEKVDGKFYYNKSF